MRDFVDGATRWAKVVGSEVGYIWLQVDVIIDPLLVRVHDVVV